MTVIQTINNSVRRIPNWVLYLLGPLPVAWVFYAGINGQLGIDPAKAIEQKLGLWGLWLLIASLLITPLRTYLNINLIKMRRAIGVLAFFYILAHLLVWLVLDIQLLWGQIWADILKRPYITIGMAGFAAMTPLAVTSNNLMIRKLGPVKWGRLHKLSYFIVAAGGVHFLMVRKGWQIEPVIYLAGIAVLLAMRGIWAVKKRAKRRVTA